MPLRPAAGDLSAFPSVISADGSVVGGQSFSHISHFGTPRVVRWTVSGGSGLVLPSPAISNAQVTGITSDGELLIGAADARAVTWASGGATFLPVPPPQGTSGAFGVSANGSVISGTVSTVGGSAAAIWTNGVLTTTLSGGTRGGPLTPDGQMLFGTYRDPVQPQVSRLFRWTAGSGMELLSGGAFASDFLGAPAATPDGLGVLLNIRAVGDPNLSSVIWSAGVLQDLGFLPGTSNNIAYAMSANGQVAGGYCSTMFGSASQAYVWTATEGIVPFATFLQGHGMASDGWIFNSIRGISADGTMFIGYGIDPTTQALSGFLVTVPAPSAIAVMGMSLMLGRRRPVRGPITSYRS